MAATTQVRLLVWTCALGCCFFSSPKQPHEASLPRGATSHPLPVLSVARRERQTPERQHLRNPPRRARRWRSWAFCVLSLASNVASPVTMRAREDAGGARGRPSVHLRGKAATRQAGGGSRRVARFGQCDVVSWVSAQAAALAGHMPPCVACGVGVARLRSSAFVRLPLAYQVRLPT